MTINVWKLSEQIISLQVTFESTKSALSLLSYRGSRINVFAPPSSSERHTIIIIYVNAIFSTFVGSSRHTIQNGFGYKNDVNSGLLRYRYTIPVWLLVRTSNCSSFSVPRSRSVYSLLINLLSVF